MEHHKKLAILVGGGPAPGINAVIGAATIRAALEGMDVVGVRDGFEWLMQGDIEHITPLTIDAVSRIHFRGGSHIGISRANPTVGSEVSRKRRDLAAATGRDAAADDRRRRHGVLGDEGRRTRWRPHPRGACAEDDRQRSRSAADGQHVRVPDRAALWRRNRQEPHGGCEDHLALVLRDHDGTQSRPSGARHRQGRRRDAHADSRGVPEAAATQDDRRHARRRDHQASELRTAGWRGDDCRRRRARRRSERPLLAARSGARRARDICASPR